MKTPKAVLAYILVSIVGIVLFFILILPVFQKWRAENRTARHLMENISDLPYYRKKLDSLESELQVLTRNRDRGLTPTGLLTEIPKLAGLSGIRTVRVENTGDNPGSALFSTVRIRFQSDFRTAAGFLNALENLPVSVRMDSLDMSVESDGLSVSATAVFSGLQKAGTTP